MTAQTHPTPTPIRGGALDLLRFLAAAFIVLYHFGPDAPVPLDELAPVMGRGWLATDFFLMLSGYVLGRAYGRALDEARIGGTTFFARRLARVWPAHALVLAGFVVLTTVAVALGLGPEHPERFGLADLVSQLALTHAWGFSQNAGWNEPSWTLSALVACYALFPVAWRLSGPLHGRASAVVGAAVVLAAGAAGSLILLDHSVRDLPFQFGVFRAVPLFLAGLLLARFAAGFVLPRSVAIGLISAATGLLVCLQASPGEAAGLVSLAAIGTIVLACDRLGGAGSRLVEGAARLAFALFITHALAGAVWFGGLGWVEERYVLSAPAAWAAWGGALVFALAGAWAFHRWVDAPIQNRLRARLDASTEAPRWSWPVRDSSTA